MNTIKRIRNRIWDFVIRNKFAVANIVIPVTLTVIVDAHTTRKAIQKKPRQESNVSQNKTNYGNPY